MRAVGGTSQDAPVTLIPNFLDQEAADQVFGTLLGEIPWERRTTEIYGKEVAVPRLEVWVAEHPYSYSGRTYQPKPWTPTLVKIRNEIEAAARTKFNSVLLNRYEDGNDSVGWQADNEPEMSSQHSIASLSLGASTRVPENRGERGCFTPHNRSTRNC